MKEDSSQGGQRPHAWHDALRTIGIYLLTSAVGFVGVTVFNQNALIAGMKVQMDSIQRDTNNQALKLDQLPQLSSQIATLDVRVSDNTRRINELEQVRKLK